MLVVLASKVQLRALQLMVKLATGAGCIATVTLPVLALVPLASVTVSVTEYVPAAAYVRLVVTPAPDVPSPNVHPYAAPGSAVELLPLKLQVKPVQLDVKFATGGVVGGVVAMKPV